MKGQPKRWIDPLEELKKSDKPIFRTGLKVNNSLTNTKVEFVSKDGSPKVTWYMCGPTVYDSAHLGHARTYLTFDIIRRILTSYFGYDVSLCMNITDIDDKIIKRSNEQGIEFSKFAKMWEDDFFKDMRSLNIMYPTYITRVSEYIPEIINFVKVIMDKGYAYEKNGSVYFDIEAYKKGNHMYAKLVPQDKVQNIEELEEAEGALSKDNINEKKGKGDFALWKKSKENEPFWDSPWGKGRPGWHIECSVMSSSIFGKSLDIHSGGIDLRFPHHDNEIAQTEAHDDSAQWINYFFHTGHLKIEGLKMSKSLKNFKKISDFINVYTPNTFRLYFCSCKWDIEMDFTEKGLGQANTNDKYISQFFQNLKVLLRENDLKRDLKFNEIDDKLNEALKNAEQTVHEAYCDNFNTPLVITTIFDLISKTYEYEKNAKDKIKVYLLYSIGRFISKILTSLGLVYSTEFIEYFKFSQGENKSAEETLTPYIDALSEFRNKIKNECTGEKDIKKLLSYCDELRDEILPNLGVVIEDKGKDKPSIWKFYDKEQYLEEKRKQNEIKEALKKQKEEEKAAKEKKLSTPAKEYYASLTDQYSKWNEEGIPTHNAKGVELNQNQFNKLKKDFAKHEKNHQKWKEEQAKKAKEEPKKDKKKGEKEDKKDDKKKGGKDEKKGKKDSDNLQSKLPEYEKKLEKNMFLNGDNPGKLDAEALNSCRKNNFIPDQNKNFNFWSWYSNMILFDDHLVNSWTEDKKGGKKEKDAQKKDDKKKEAPKKDDKKKGDKKKDENEINEDDLFGDMTKDEEEALKVKKPKDKKGKKEKKSEKSCVLMDVKGYESDQDLNSLAKKIMKEIKMDGLLWNKEYKLEEVAFGIKKIVMGMVVEDEKVSVDEVIEKIQEYEDEVQSVEITSFNKI